MSELVLMPTDTAQMQALINEGQVACGQFLSEETESYLVFALLRNMADVRMANRIMALEFLHAQNTKNTDDLRDVADRCLIFAGFFPGLAEKRFVRISYFVRIGITAYSQLSDRLVGKSSLMYAQLSREFVPLMDVLLSVRSIGNPDTLDLLESTELWKDCRSRYAKQQMFASLGNNIPVFGAKTVQ